MLPGYILKRSIKKKNPIDNEISDMRGATISEAIRVLLFTHTDFLLLIAIVDSYIIIIYNKCNILDGVQLKNVLR